ncbi:MAG TPA: D-2-hydroxyacid dehydrogenase [Deinococcales bacterium]|nr:D-2-hydroxyacid dehydrogenase [Deinococcales bacterium]
MPNVLICSYLEPALVERIRAVDPGLNVEYHPELLPKPRYKADHVGSPLARTPDEQARWEELLSRAEVLFDFDYTGVKDLPDRAPRVRWVQASSAGIGQFVRRHAYDKRMDARFTTASGVHARPLAEYVLMSMLQVVKRAALAREQQAAHRWQRFATDELSGKTLGIVGLGRIGREVARLARAFDMRVIATKRSTEGEGAASLGIDQLHPWTALHDLLAESDFVCLVCPHTPETENLIDEAAFKAMRPGATLINIARGAVVDEPALIRALQSGQVGHAALDVAAVEPLPADSPLWDLANVSIYPHSASTNDRENDRLVDLFCENLRRYLRKEPLLNTLDPERMY